MKLHIGSRVMVAPIDRDECDVRVAQFGRDTDGSILVTVVDQEDNAFQVSMGEIVEVLHGDESGERESEPPPVPLDF